MGGSKTTVQTQGTTTQPVPQQMIDNGAAITGAAMNTYFDPASKYKSYTPGNSDYQKFQEVGAATTGQLNDLNGKGGAAQTNYQNAESAYQPYFDQAKDTATSAYDNNHAQQANGPNYSQQSLDQFMNPYLSSVTQAGANQLQNAFNISQSQTADQAAKAGAFGGARQGVQAAEQTRNFGDTYSKFIADSLNTGFQNAQNQYNTNFNQGLQTTQANNAAAGQNFNQGNTLAQTLQGLGQASTNNQLAVGQANQQLGNVWTAQDQAQKDNSYNKGYLDQRDWPMQIYGQLSSINAGQPYTHTSTTNGTSSQSQSGGWLGPALSFGGQAMSMMSDERAKEDIAEHDAEETLGAFAKIRPKTYRYKDEVIDAHPGLTRPGQRTGFMVQDAERAFRGSVGRTTPDGFKTVDVGDMLGKLVTAVHGLEKRTRGLKQRTA